MLYTEDFLQYVWKFRLFDRADLRTVDGQTIEIFSTGMHNTDSGPDFSNARIRVGDVLTFMWAGEVRVWRVVALGERRGPPDEARSLYEELSEGLP